MDLLRTERVFNNDNSNYKKLNRITRLLRARKLNRITMHKDFKISKNLWKQTLVISLIGHGFYTFLPIVYKYFNIYLLRYRIYLEYLQVQRRFGGMWWFWCLLEPFECRAAQTRQMFSNGSDSSNKSGR